MVEEKITHRPPWFIEKPKFVNTREFSAEARHFLKYGHYTRAPKGSYEYKSYWDEQTRRCKEGYSVGGLKITGRYYHYLNFTQIEARVKTESGRNRRILTFPSFLDIDYYYYWEIEKAMDAGEGMCVGKARRKGFSFKNSHLCTYDYNFVKDSSSVIGAYLSEYSDNTMNMAKTMLNFMDKNTAWSKRRNPDTKSHVRARYEKNVGGKKVWAGYNSQIYTLTFHNNASAAIGKAISFMLWEEAGKWNNLVNSYNLTLPTFVDGDITTGFWIIFGTGGDMESGATAGFEELFYNPKKYKLRAFDLNDYDPDQMGDAGFFVDDTWYKPPFVDKNGISDRDGALKSNLARRDELEKGAKSTVTIDDYMTQYPITPSESFLITTGAYFPAKKIMDQINKITQDKKLANIGIKGHMSADEKTNKAVFVMDEDVYEAPYPFDMKQKEGCVVIYEHPEKLGDDIPYGLYLASTDPYMHDDSTGDSLGSTFIYKKFYSAEKTSDILVAEYTGRPETTEDYYEQVRLLLLYYNARCLYENQFKDMKTHFQHKQSLHLLAPQPMIVKDIIPKSEVSRGYGVHMPIAMKQAAVIYLRDWLKTEISPGITNISKIYSVNLLKELLRFNFQGNFDRVSSLLVMMIYIKENQKIQLNAIEKDRKKTLFGDLNKALGWKEDVV
jgi:hypothetical protein